MTITVNQLRKFLSNYPDDMEVTDEYNEPLIHIVNTERNSVVISTQKPIACCSRTGGYVYPTTTKGYFGFSFELNEDVYEFETEPLSCEQ